MKGKKENNDQEKEPVEHKSSAVEQSKEKFPKPVFAPNCSKKINSFEKAFLASIFLGNSSHRRSFFLQSAYFQESDSQLDTDHESKIKKMSLHPKIMQKSKLVETRNYWIKFKI